jgi:hypothetical protein
VQKNRSTCSQKPENREKYAQKSYDRCADLMSGQSRQRQNLDCRQQRLASRLQIFELQQVLRTPTNLHVLLVDC